MLSFSYYVIGIQRKFVFTEANSDLCSNLLQCGNKILQCVMFLKIHSGLLGIFLYSYSILNEKAQGRHIWVLNCMIKEMSGTTI